jgi:CRP/FNR family cyclic AMP-dependent transcriptional regulator
MACDIDILKKVPVFGLLDDDELTVLAAQTEAKTFAPRQRIYRMGDSGGRAYVIVSGSVRVTTIDEDKQEVLIDQPGEGEFFGFCFDAGSVAPPD